MKELLRRLSYLWNRRRLEREMAEEMAYQAYLDLLRARAAAFPDVEATSQAWLEPWGGLHMGADWMGRQFAGNRVDPQFLDTLGIRLVRGRNFRPGEDGVALVNEATARVLWPDQEALGKALPWGGQTVIGLVGNASTGYVGNPEPLVSICRRHEATLPTPSCWSVSRDRRDRRVMLSGVSRTPPAGSTSGCNRRCGWSRTRTTRRCRKPPPRSR